MPTPTDNRSSHRAGLKQIADELGISMMTVSRALNGRGDVAESTRLRVLKAAKRFKYRPNRLVAEHLLALGHRRLGHITGEPWVSTYAERRRGFEEVVPRLKGVDLSVADCADVDSEAAARAMLSRPDRPTAIFVPNDRMAPPIYEVAESLGLVIGRDLSVIGFGSLEEAKWLRPRLSTVDQRPHEIGRAAAGLLLDRIEGRVGSPKPRSARVVPTIVERESARPPRPGSA